MMNVLRLCVLCVIAVLGVSGVRAQCTPVWRPFDPTTATFPGVSGTVNATTTWDPDGPGPQTPKLVIGGSFTVAGTVLANNIALYDPATGAWSALGSGMSNGAGPAIVFALTALPSGDLIAAGLFTTAGGVTVNHIARWNGSAWSAMGLGMSGSVLVLTTLPNGDLIAGGGFNTAGGVNIGYGIARWNGSAWSALGTGMNGQVLALTTLPNGDLIAGGEFTTAGGVNIGYGIARWNGSAWSALGAGMSGPVEVFTTLPSGDLIAGGIFTTAGGIIAPYLARWGCPPPTACSPADLADTDGEPGADGTIDNGDFNAFFIAFFAAEGNPLRAAADIANTDGDTALTGGGPDGTIDNGDFNAFFLYFFQGCP